MTNLDHMRISQQMMLGFVALHTPLKTVRSLFFNRELYEVYSSNGNHQDVLVEVCFDSAGLVCQFDQDAICEAVYIIPDKPTEITLYTEYCQATYPYDPDLERWQMNDFLIRLIFYKKEYCLSISPLKKRSIQ